MSAKQSALMWGILIGMLLSYMYRRYVAGRAG